RGGSVVPPRTDETTRKCCVPSALSGSIPSASEAGNGLRFLRGDCCGGAVRTIGLCDGAITKLSSSSEIPTPPDRLREAIRAHDSMLVAFSGGVDSTLVLRVAHEILGNRSAGLLAVSESLPRSERDEAVALAAEIGAPLHVVHSREMEDPRYRS